LYKFTPTLFSENQYHLAIGISSIWLMISIILLLDPNLAEKISTIKSFKEAIKDSDL
jgi:hypothetical protein